MSETLNAEGTPAVAVQRVVSRPHPWKSNFSNQQKLKEAKRCANLRRMKKYRDDGKEYFRLTEKTWHETHPNGAGTNNPRFTERAIKANAAKRQAANVRMSDGGLKAHD